MSVNRQSRCAAPDHELRQRGQGESWSFIKSHVTYSLNSFKQAAIGLMKGDTKSLDYSSVPPKNLQDCLNPKPHKLQDCLQDPVNFFAMQKAPRIPKHPFLWSTLAPRDALSS